MPRRRRTPKMQINLARLIEHPHQPYSRRSSRILSNISHHHVAPSRCRMERSPIHIARSRSPHIRTRRNSQRNTAIWTTAVYPISILECLPSRRGIRKRRSYRSRSRRNQRTGTNKTNGGTSNNQSRTNIPTSSAVVAAAAAVAAEVEMPCRATESPTAETQLQLTSNNTDFSCQQPSAEPVFTPPISTVILHHNPLFDAEGKTQSGLIDKHIQMAPIDQAKSRWQMQGDKMPKQPAVKPSVELKDAAKKKSRAAVEKKVPAKKGSDSDVSSKASNSHSTLNSAGSSEKSKSDTEESHSYEDSIDLTNTESVDVNTNVVDLQQAQGSQVRRRLERNASKAPLALNNTPEPKQPRTSKSVNGVLQSDDILGAPTAHINLETMLAK
uniref:Uncharacterized protein n=1 Tax=Bactrocera latifrons TaxID=174628 RepID=A0A0K8VG48_BACLA